MKVTKKQLLAFTPHFAGMFANEVEVFDSYSDTNYDGVVTPAFNTKDVTILYADYTYECYSGDSYVFGYNKSTKSFFGVYGGHCSCYGLEGQWREDEISIKEIIALKSDWLDNPFIKEEDYYSRSACKSEELHNWWQQNLAAA